jgi:hypothetical protein
MNEGATTVGSIQLDLEVKNAEANAKLDETKAKAEALGTADADVKVKVDGAAAAAAQIKLVEAEVARLREGQRQATVQTIVYGNQVKSSAHEMAFAISQLDEMLKSGTASDEKLAAASVVAARAQAAQTKAVNSLTAAQLRLKAVNEALAAIPGGNPLSPEPTKPPASGGAGSGGGGGGGKMAVPGFMGMVLIAIVALLPIMAALAGTIAAVTGSFMGMGAAAFLAGLGIKHAMADGTAAGNVFAGGLHLLKGSLDSLAATAAGAMLGHFQIAVSQINEGMPGLNAEIKVFSGLLGTTGNIVLGTLIAGFKILLPLFTQAGVYIEQVAVGFQKWTSNGGLASFAHMASTSLPQVTAAIGSLLNGLFSLIGALQPLGVVMLGAITIIGVLLRGVSLLGPALSPIVGIAAAVAGGFFLWGKISPIIDTVRAAIVKFGVSTSISLGVIGLLVAVVGYLASELVGAAAATDQATTAMDDYTSAVQQDNGVVGANVKAQVASNLQKQGAFDMASKLGIATKTLTDATLGNATAQQKLKADIAAATTKIDVQQKAMDSSRAALAAGTVKLAGHREALKGLTDAYSGNTDGIRKAFKAYNDIAHAEGATTIETKAQLDAVTALAASYGESVPVYLTAQVSQKQAATQLEATTALMKAQGDAAGLLKLALDNLNGKNLDAASTQNAFDQGLAGLTPVTSTTTGGPTAAQLAAGQTSVSSSTASHTLAVEALTIAQNNYNNALSKDTSLHSAASAKALTSAHLALGRAQNTVTNSTTAVTTASNNLITTQSQASKTVTTGSAALDGMSKAAITNRGNIISLITSAQLAAAAYRGQTDAQGKLTHSATDTATQINSLKQQIIDSAAAAGINAAQVQTMVDQLFQIPATIPDITVKVDTTQATEKLTALQALLIGVAGVNMTSTGGVVFSDARNSASYPKNAGGGTVGGAGSTTSDSNVVRLSRGEEVVKASSAMQARPFLKAFNADPRKALAMAAGSGGTTTHNSYPTTMIVQQDPRQAFDDFQRRNNMRRA